MLYTSARKCINLLCLDTLDACVFPFVRIQSTIIQGRAQYHIKPAFISPRDASGAGYLSNNSSILGTSSGILNGLDTTSSYAAVSDHVVRTDPYALTIPASSAVCTCSARAFAVTAMIGTCPVNLPSLSNSLILLVHVNPSMTGIS